MRYEADLKSMCNAIFCDLSLCDSSGAMVTSKFSSRAARRAVVWMNGQIESQTHGQVDRWTDGRMDKMKHDTQMGGGTDRKM